MKKYIEFKKGGILKILLLFVLMLFPQLSFSEELSAPVEFEAFDKPSDDGTGIILTWKKMDYEDEATFYIPLISNVFNVELSSLQNCPELSKI